MQNTALLETSEIFTTPFKIPDTFFETYKTKKPPFGFNGLGEFVYYRTYSREKEDGSKETWYETVRRVVEGTYSIQKRWIQTHQLGWDDEKAQRSAQEMYDRMFNMKFLPPGRGLWAMGTSIIEEKSLFPALYNCAFCSTKNIAEDKDQPFRFVMDLSMLGVGVGFDLKGADKLIVHGCLETETMIVIPDSREGWVDSLSELILAYVDGRDHPVFDYSIIRKKGEIIKTFGGTASGPEPLMDLHKDVEKILINRIGKALTERDILDIMNMIGRTVVAGNVRRTAEIAFQEYNGEQIAFLKYKNYEENPDRAEFGWTSNNSIMSALGVDYAIAAESTALNGEPGYVWPDNFRGYSRMIDPPDHKDHRADGTNPCVEQTLESYEMCNLVETFLNNHEDLNDFLRTLKFAYLYGKTVTLGKSHWQQSNRIMLRNRRIGTSVTGVAQFIAANGIHDLKNWLTEGFDTIQYYDDVYSEWFAIPKSIKTTSIKPSGTVSLLAGATPGGHFPESRFYIRRVRIAKTSPFIKALQDAGYHLEDDVKDASSMVVEFPIDVGEGVRTLNDVSMWEQLSVAAFLQKYWADNQVSYTVTFKEHEAKDIKNALDYFQYQLKGISFLPKDNHGYEQAPYEETTEAIYLEMRSKLKELDFSAVTNIEAVGEKFCSNDTCTI